MKSYDDPPIELLQALGSVNYWYGEFTKEAKCLTDRMYMAYCVQKWRESADHLIKVKKKINYKSHYDRGI